MVIFVFIIDPMGSVPIGESNASSAAVLYEIEGQLKVKPVMYNSFLDR